MNNKTLLIVGDTSGIGQATALLAAQWNYSIVIAGRNEQKAQKVVVEVSSTQTPISFIQTDIADAKQIEGLVDETIRLYGRLDHACNCAAIDEGLNVLLADVEEDYDRQMGVNLKGI